MQSFYYFTADAIRSCASNSTQGKPAFIRSEHSPSHAARTSSEHHHRFDEAEQRFRFRETISPLHENPHRFGINQRLRVAVRLEAAASDFHNLRLFVAQLDLIIGARAGFGRFRWLRCLVYWPKKRLPVQRRRMPIMQHRCNRSRRLLVPVRQTEAIKLLMAVLKKRLTKCNPHRQGAPIFWHMAGDPHE